MSETRDDEQRAAAALAQALESLEEPGAEPRGESFGAESDGVDVAELVQVAERVRASAGFAAPLAPELRDSIVAAAIERGAPSRRPLLRLFVGAAAAAAVLFLLGIAYWAAPWMTAQPQEPVAGVAGMGEGEAFAAPTDGLFDGPFPEDQTPAQRMDRILQARTRGYFAAVMLKRSSSPVRTAAVIGSSQ